MYLSKEPWLADGYGSRGPGGLTLGLATAYPVTVPEREPSPLAVMNKTVACTSCGQKEGGLYIEPVQQSQGAHTGPGTSGGGNLRPFSAPPKHPPCPSPESEEESASPQPRNYLLLTNRPRPKSSSLSSVTSHPTCSEGSGTRAVRATSLGSSGGNATHAPKNKNLAFSMLQKKQREAGRHAAPVAPSAGGGSRKGHNSASAQAYERMMQQQRSADHEGELPSGLTGNTTRRETGVTGGGTRREGGEQRGKPAAPSRGMVLGEPIIRISSYSKPHRHPAPWASSTLMSELFTLPHKFDRYRSTHRPVLGPNNANFQKSFLEEKLRKHHGGKGSPGKIQVKGYGGAQTAYPLLPSLATEEEDDFWKIMGGLTEGPPPPQGPPPPERSAPPEGVMLEPPEPSGEPASPRKIAAPVRVPSVPVASDTDTDTDVEEEQISKKKEEAPPVSDDVYMPMVIMKPQRQEAENKEAPKVEPPPVIKKYKRGDLTRKTTFRVTQNPTEGPDYAFSMNDIFATMDTARVPMQTWLAGNLTQQNSRFELPADMKLLEKMSPTDYLRRFCIIPTQREAYYDQAFSRYKDKAAVLSMKDMSRALRDILTDTITEGDIAQVCAHAQLHDDTAVDRRLFLGVAAMAERMLCPKYLGAKSMEEKENVECADFSALEWKIKGVKLQAPLRGLLKSLIP